MSALARFEQYLDWRFSQSGTPIHYLSDLKIFIGFIGDEPPKTITAADIGVWLGSDTAGESSESRSAGW